MLNGIPTLPARGADKRDKRNHMKRFKMVGAAGALVAAAVIGGTLFSSVLAAPTATDTTTTVAANGSLGSTYMDTYLDALASELGVDRAALGPAAAAAANAAIDAAETAGDISADRATELRDRLAAITAPESLLYGHGVLRGGPGHGPGGPGMGGGLHGALDAAATALNLDQSDLVSQVRDGSSLMDIATAQGVDYSEVVSAITDAVSSDLATDVSDGRITQDRADAVTSELQAWLDAGGQADALPFGFGHGDRGPGPPGAPDGNLGI